MRTVLNGKIVLVVDDEPELREILCDELHFVGCKTLEASDGRAAFSMATVQPVDAVVSDLRMPGGDGDELLQRLGQHMPQLAAVILMSGQSHVSEIEAFANGANAFFKKPIDYENLIDTLASLLTPAPDRWRRIEPRYKSNFKITLSLSSESEAVQSRVLNFGRGGFFAQIVGDLPKVDQVISFDITIGSEGRSAIKGLGIVKWCRDSNKAGLPRGCGIEFVNLTEDCLEMVVALTQAVSSRTHIPKS